MPLPPSMLEEFCIPSCNSASYHYVTRHICCLPVSVLALSSNCRECETRDAGIRNDTFHSSLQKLIFYCVDEMKIKFDRGHLDAQYI